METVEAGRHEECCAVDRILEREWRVNVLVALHEGEEYAKQDGQRQARDEALAIIVDQRMMRPRDRRAGEQQDDRVVKRQVQRVENLNTLWRPYAAGKCCTRYLLGFPGKRLASKKAQNQATKNITSEAMNMIMP